MRSRIAISGAGLLALSLTVASVAARAEKKVLSAEAYARWQHLEHPALSADGQWTAYILQRADSDGTLVVRATRGTDEFRVPHVTSFLFPKRSGRYLAYTRVPHASDAVLDPSEWRKQSLVVRDLHSGTEVQIPGVTEFVFDGPGRHLAYAVAAEQEAASGIYLLRLVDGKVTPLLTGRGHYRSLAFDTSGEQLAFLSNRDDLVNTNPRHSVYHARLPWTTAEPAVRATALEGDLTVAARVGVRFSRAGNALLFSLVPAVRESAVREASAEEANLGEESQFEIWDWTEPQPFPQGIPPEPTGPFLAVYHLTERRFAQLGNPALPEVWLSADARQAIGIDRIPYRVQNTWDRPTADVYRIDAHSGESQLIRRGVRSTLESFVAFSPSGRYLLTFENRRWFSYDLVQQRLVDLTGALLPTMRFDIEGALSGSPPAGLAGWMPEDRRVLIYDRHDLWEVDPTGATAPHNLTQGIGRRENLRFRLWADYNRALDAASASREGAASEPHAVAEQALMDPRQPLLLAALDRDTMASGIWRIRLNASSQPEKLLMFDKRVRPIAWAANATQYLLSIESFREYPDLWSGSRFDRLQRISDANPQAQEYRWGTAELIDFTSSLAVPLKARLYKPEGFDPAKKYPLIVSIGERASEQLHHHSAPQPLATALPAEEAAPVFVSKGYMVLVPDVEPAIPYPGQSAVASVVPAVKEMIRHRYIDPSRICLTGHGFGGYAVAYVLTQTHLFRCAIEGAGVTNTISAYASLRTRARSFEHGPWRHGASIWEKPFVYLTNSPLWFADKVTTPLLMLHNDGEQAIPYDQAFELFTGLRRNGKEVYLLNYGGEGEVLRKPENRLDWDRRVHQFLDHFLTDAPKPSWFDFPSSEDAVSRLPQEVVGSRRAQLSELRVIHRSRAAP